MVVWIFYAVSVDWIGLELGCIFAIVENYIGRGDMICYNKIDFSEINVVFPVMMTFKVMVISSTRLWGGESASARLSFFAVPVGDCMAVTPAHNCRLKLEFKPGRLSFFKTRKELS